MGKKRKFASEKDPNDPEKDWSFTKQNPTEADEALWRRIFEEVSYGLVTREIAPTTGTPHLQGRVVFRRSYRFSQLIKQEWADKWSMTKCCQDSLYCLKKDSVIIVDKPQKQGQRSDLVQCVERAAAGATMKELYTEFPGTMVRYNKGIMEAKKALADPEKIGEYTLADFPNWEPIKDWSKSVELCGNSGIGKTEWACAHFSNPLLVSEIDQLLDYDKDVHDGIVFDDMDFCATKVNNTRSLQICLTDNKMPRGIRCRYRTPIIPRGTKKIFTCNQHCFDVDDPAIRRRIAIVCAVDRDTDLNFVSQVTE